MDVIVQLHAPAVLPSGKNPDTPSIGGSVGPRTGLYVLETRKNIFPHKDLNPGSKARTLVTVTAS
jgi:hypothetical protein